MDVEYAVRTISLTKDFGALRAVDRINLKVERGSFYGFLGPNGAGKSTTIKILTGLMGPTFGSARLLGLDLVHDSLNIKKKIGVVPEDLCLFENLTPREYLIFIARMYRIPKNVYQSRCDELLSLLDLDDCGKKLVLELSHGMKKKLSLAAAILHDPELLFLDEPFEGVDAIASRTIRNVLQRLIQRGATIFLTSHVLEIVERLCTHVGIISDGVLVKQASMDEFAGGSLENTFVEVVGKHEKSPDALSWLSGEANV